MTFVYALRAEILGEILCGNGGLSLQKLDHALFPPPISPKISSEAIKLYGSPSFKNSQILKFLKKTNRDPPVLPLSRGIEGVSRDKF